MSTWSQINFMDGVTPFMQEFTFFHDFANMIILTIILFVLGVMVKMFTNNTIHKSLVQGHLLECIWTLIPGIILIQLALPSLVLLYTLEEYLTQKTISVKTLGHQWFWSYDYPEFTLKDNDLEFDSYMTPTQDLPITNFRLLEVDNRLNLPYPTSIQILISSTDVLHSWTVPSMGVKADATPGRVNQVSIQSFNPGIFYGQCSEICGANHSFMPIVIQSVPMHIWLKNIV